MQIHDHGNDSLRFLQFHLGGDRNFHYLIGDPRTGEAAAVDPGFEAEAFAGLADSQGLTIERILITHGHGDHTGAAARLAELTGARIHAGDPAAVPGAVPLADDELIKVGSLIVRALATPGHAPDHFCFLVADALVTGDLLFCGKVGGTGPYFPGSSAEQEYESLMRILKLPPATRVFPGHDYYGGEGTRRHSTIGHERDHNPFLTAGSFGAFCSLKENWAAYKKEHGIR
ncbi:MAG: hydroxyacylglutathione hydrolase family protein [bacterium]